MKKIEELPKKAQEKIADQFMSVSTSIFTAVFVSILIMPMVEIIKIIIDPTAKLLTLQEVFQLIFLHKIYVLFFLIFYFFALVMSNSIRNLALNIYERISKD